MVTKPLLDRTPAPPAEVSGPAPAAYLARPAAPGVPALERHLPSPSFEWALNPYVGCELACTYCCARVDGNFDLRILGREDLPGRLERDLRMLVAPGHRIALGTATDPYQPFEREREITRHCLRVLARHEGLRLSITTKSDLVLRDLDLLRVIALRSALHVNVTVTTLDRRMAAALEPRAPAPNRRLRAVRTLSAEGIETGVLLMPVLPGLTDGPGALEAVAEAASCAGARFLGHRLLFLREPVRSLWFRRLRERWPALRARYRVWYADEAHGDPALVAALDRRVARARRRHGLADGPTDRAAADPQLVLPFIG